MGHPLRVAHVGTGHTGSIALRQILRSPDLELVGHLVHNPEKVGRDSGELVGAGAVGIVTSDRFEDLLTLDADCVTYASTDSGREISEVLDQICAILASGKSVVTIIPALVYPAALEEAALAKLQSACAAGNSSFFPTGIAPGFTTDVLAVHLASLSEQPTRVAVQERILCGTYGVPSFFGAFGFGRTPEQDAQLYQPGMWTAHFAAPMQLLADGVGLTVDEIREFKDVALADRDYAFPAGPIPAGTIASARLRFEGIVAGTPRLTISSIWSMPDDTVDDWEPAFAQGSPSRRITRITVEGNPSVHIDFAVDGGGLPGADATAARVVNAITAVCAAPPGVYSALDLIVRGRAEGS